MTYPSFDLYKLRIFVTAVESGSLSAAAERLFMSQPAVSQHIHELENTLGTVLLTRSHRGVTLTEAGQVFYRYAQRLLALAAEANQAIAAFSSGDRLMLKLAATPGISTYLLPGWLAAFREHHTEVMICTQTATTPEITAQVQGRQVDLGIIEGELDETDASLSVQLLGEAAQYLIVSPAHPLAAHAEVSWEALHDLPFVTRQPGSQTRIWLDQAMLMHGVSPRIVAEFDSPESIKRLVMTSNVASILPGYAVREEVAAGKLRALELRPPLRRAIRAVWSRAQPLSPHAQALLR
ncbi:MAG: LysR family transcriptional regulator, partial [Thermoflexales bacterium]|nr:LysR family transcriptional regulator [Thermoflexales bacterium]